MAALSRNTASVAQDFHNAGGGVKTFTSNHSAEENYRQIIAKHTKQSASSKSPSKSNPSMNPWIDYSMASADVSPPATNPNPDITTKKRRSTYNKENTENVIPSIPSRIQCNQTDQVTNLKQHFDNYIRDQFHNSKKLSSTFNDFSSKRKSFTFESHPELEVSIQNESNESNDRLEKRNRKQSQPRKIEQCDEIDGKASPIDELTTEHIDLNNIRDKHLVRMVSRKKCCFKCKNRNKFMMLSYHTMASLILHTKWRHGHEQRLCEMRKCARVGRNMRHKCGQRITKINL